MEKYIRFVRMRKVGKAFFGGLQGLLLSIVCDWGLEKILNLMLTLEFICLCLKLVRLERKNQKSSGDMWCDGRLWLVFKIQQEATIVRLIPNLINWWCSKLHAFFLFLLHLLKTVYKQNVFFYISNCIYYLSWYCKAWI